MKIKEIVLYNFGSYEGINIFDLTSDEPGKRIVIIGGKNGSGKTTFFTAIQLCLYGNFAFGYKNVGSRYLKKVSSLINNKARLKEDETAYITVEFEHTDARDQSDYSVTRKWDWLTGNVEESVTVFKNGAKMDLVETLTFQNYLIHLIPPDMLKLYFFDGEKIADYFLSDSKINVREALMILSGNDTFDILQNNVRRVLKLNKEDDSHAAEYYMDSQDIYNEAKASLRTLQNARKDLQAQKENEESKLAQIKTEYVSKGGLTMEEWNDLQSSLKIEESTREHIRGLMRTVAMDILPFVILQDWIDKISQQIAREEDYAAFRALDSKLSKDSFRDMLALTLKKVGVDSVDSVDEILAQIMGNLLSEDWSGFTPLFQLSNDEKIQVQLLLGRVFDYNSNTLKNFQADLDDSLQTTKQIRSKLQNSDIEHIEEYIKETTRLEGEIKIIQVRMDQNAEEISHAEEELSSKMRAMENARIEFENTLKKESVAALSGRVMLLLEDLQNEIYTGLIEKVKVDLKIKLNQLIRKSDFFDDINIDSDFNVHIIKNQMVSVEDLLQIVRKGGLSSLKSSIGELAVKKLFMEQEANTTLVKLLKNIPTETVELPVEINKEIMSSGEKQIFVMSLYWALMQQSENELPFTIDTPFARIDKEHRVNITKYFFLALSGQVFILSTDEEIEQEHLDTMKGEIAHVYLLEYGEDKRTRIYKDTYFEV